MPGKNFQLTPLESRKQLLLVESELNRVQLLVELRELQGEWQQLKEQAQAIGSVAAAAAKVAATVSAIGSVFTPRQDNEKGKSSWLSTLLNGARTGAALWAAWQSHRK
jgi:hypothetical protein